MMKDTFYFSHDYNARTDVKIKRLLAKTGYRGYGVFWAVIEDLYNNANALPTDYDSIAFDLREDAEFVKSIVCDFDLFVFEGNIFGSTSVERRLSERNEKSEKARQSAIKRWNKMPTQSEGNANALPTQSEGNAIKERKVKELNKYLGEQFDIFWGLYNKGSKIKTREKFMKLTPAEVGKIQKHLKHYFAANPEVKFRKDAERYLSHKVWETEIAQATLPEGWFNMDLTPEQMKLVPEEKLAEKKRHDVRRQMGI